MNILMHYGTPQPVPFSPRGSGRYRKGSGDDPYQHENSILARVNSLKKEGMTEVEIAKALNMTTSELRRRKSLEKEKKKAADYAFALRLKKKGYSNVAIGERMGINESSVRELLKYSEKEKKDIANSTAKILKDSVAEKKYIDIGFGTEAHLGISRTKLMTAVQALKDEGYTVHYIHVKQVGTGKDTSIMVLSEPDMPYSEVYKNRDKIRLIQNYSENGGRTYLGIEPPTSIDGKRVYIRYGEDGGSNKEGVIELRKGVDDISLGNSKYAQVRIAVDNKYYMKGMAMYSDNIPDGYDIVYNTTKHKDIPPEKVYKELKDDPDNPFGATVRQRHYKDKDGNDHLSPLNIVNEEGDWTTWSKNIASQVLSKQSPKLAKKQLDLDYDIQKEEYDDILKLTNPVVKRKLLLDFADGCDSAAVELKAAALPRQASHVILPINSLKDNEIYAQNYRNGETVVLIRYPHGGIFEIPELKVNNHNKEGNALLKQSKDAVGINPKVAQVLSGADFDGDTVLVIPNNNKYIKTSSPLKGLKDFDPKVMYPKYDGMKVLSEQQKQKEMGRITNLITDMTIEGASTDEICRAVRHSMVVIDAVKHELNYKQSEIENGIQQLRDKYQNGGGASTLISLAGSEYHVPMRKEKINPKTGEKEYIYKPEFYFDKKKNKVVERTLESTQMYETKDAYSLSSGTVIENIYADYANKMKALGNKSRKEALAQVPVPYSPSANKVYSEEVESLKGKLNLAYRNKPLERQAQLLANTVISEKLKENPNMDKDHKKKMKAQALIGARFRVGAKKHPIDITDREWEAIQAGAISKTKLKEIVDNIDNDVLKKLAMPKNANIMSSSKIAKAKSMLNLGYSQAEVADALGVSVSTIRNNVLS